MRDPAVGVEQPLQPHARKDRLARLRPGRKHPADRPRAQRIAAEIVIGQPQMLDQRMAVAGQRVLRIGGGVMRLAALPMRAQVGHDDPVALGRDGGGVAVADPVGIGVGEIAVDQHHGPPLPISRQAIGVPSKLSKKRVSGAVSAKGSVSGG
ncbi:hypothetical protein GCM10020258_47150 [Sphingomonas yabuuchiae]